MLTPIYCVTEQRIGVVELLNALLVAQLAGKLGKDCTTHSHKNQKGPQAGQAHLEPALKINQMPMDVGLDELLMTQKSSSSPRCHKIRLFITHLT
jgi:hypothetical protein